MRTQILIVAAAGFGAAVACTDSVEHTTGMRVDGVKVDCAARSDGVSNCAAVAWMSVTSRHTCAAPLMLGS